MEDDVDVDWHWQAMGGSGSRPGNFRRVTLFRCIFRIEYENRCNIEWYTLVSPQPYVVCQGRVRGIDVATRHSPFPISNLALRVLPKCIGQEAVAAQGKTGHWPATI